MTNFEKIKQMSTEELTEWIQAEENRITAPAWCKGRYCEEADDDCLVCYTEWLNEEEEKC